MKSERMDRRITIQQLTQAETQSDTGFTTQVWADYVTVWAEVIQKSGREFFEAEKVNAEVVTLFKIRYRNDISNTMRISYNGRFYDILESKEWGRRDCLEIIAKAEVT